MMSRGFGVSQIPIHIGYGYPSNQTYGYRPYGYRPRPRYNPPEYYRDDYSRRPPTKPPQEEPQFGGIHFPTLIATLLVTALLLR